MTTFELFIKQSCWITILQNSLKNDLSEMSIESQPGCKQQIFCSFLDGQAMDAVVPEVDGDDEQPESCN